MRSRRQAVVASAWRMTTWLDSWSAEAVSEVLAAHGVLDGAVALQGVPQSDPQWARGHAIIGGRLVAKFALSEISAYGIARETRILRLLDGRLPVPEVAVASSDPAFLATRLVAGEPLGDGAGAAPDLVRFLTALHDPAILRLVGEDALSEPAPQATTDELRSRLPPVIRANQAVLVAGWCDWVDDVLAVPAKPVFVHGDLHGYNQVWSGGRLRLVADFDGSGAAEPEFDLRYFPSIGPGGVELLRQVLALYPRPLSLDRVMAWHVRTVLGDAMWRTEARVALPGGGTAASWVDALTRRFDVLDVGPQA